MGFLIPEWPFLQKRTLHLSPILANIGWTINYGGVSDVGRHRLSMNYIRFYVSVGVLIT